MVLMTVDPSLADSFQLDAPNLPNYLRSISPWHSSLAPKALEKRTLRNAGSGSACLAGSTSAATEIRPGASPPPLIFSTWLFPPRNGQHIC